MAIHYQAKLGAVLDELRDRCVLRIRQLDAAALQADTTEAIVDAEMELLRVEPLKLDFDALALLGEPRATKLRVPDGWGRHDMMVVDANEYTVVVPFTGDPRLVDHEPIGRMGGVSMSMPLEDAYVRGSTVQLLITAQGSEAGAVQEAIQSKVARSKDWLETQARYANNFVESWTKTAGEVLTLEVEKRRTSLDTTTAVMKSLNIPLFSAQQAVPVVRTPKPLLAAVEVTTSAKTRDAEYALTESIYDDIVETISALGLAAERLPLTSQKLTEEDLRNVILFVLNANYEGRAAGEAFSGKGKTDILLMWESRAAFIGECKIWHGPKMFLDAVDQLFSYTTWRDTRTALIIFADPSTMSDVQGKAHDALQAHDAFACDLGNSRYRMRHPKDAAKQTTVALLFVAAALKATNDENRQPTTD